MRGAIVWRIGTAPGTDCRLASGRFKSDRGLRNRAIDGKVCPEPDTGTEEPSWLSRGGKPVSIRAALTGRS